MFLETRSLTYSILLHTFVLLIAALGLPMLMPDKPEPEPMVMTVEILPIGEITNVKPSEKPITEEKHAPTPKAPKAQPPAVKEPPKEPPPPEKHFDPTEKAEPLPSEKPKPAEKEKPKEPNKKNDDFQALLNKLSQEAKANPDKKAKDTTNTEENKTKSEKPYDDSQPLSISEKDAIRNQFIPCWRMPAGSKDPGSLAVRIHVDVQPDGTVAAAEIVKDQMGRYNSDPFFRAAADSALRAVKMEACKQIKNLPQEKYNTWKSIEFNFNPADMM